MGILLGGILLMLLFAAVAHLHHSSPRRVAASESAFARAMFLFRRLTLVSSWVIRSWSSDILLKVGKSAYVYPVTTRRQCGHVQSPEVLPGKTALCMQS